LEQAVLDLEFESEEEFHRLVTGVDISTHGRRIAFKSWQTEDGSKAGLVGLLTDPQSE